MKEERKRRISSPLWRGLAWYLLVGLLIPIYHETEGTWRYFGLIGYLIVGYFFGKYFSMLEEKE